VSARPITSYDSYYTRNFCQGKNIYINIVALTSIDLRITSCR